MAFNIDSPSQLERIPEGIPWLESQSLTIAEFEAGTTIYGAGVPVPMGSNINDSRFKALGDQGFTGHLNDRLLAWLRANGATSGNLNDAWHEMLQAQAVSWSFHVNDGWFALLGALGYEGSLSEREQQFWEDGGTFEPLPPVMVESVALAYALFGDGAFQFYRMDTDPWVPVTAITDSLITNALACDFNVVAQMFALGGGGPDLEVYDATVNPMVKLFEANFGAVQTNGLRFSRDGVYLAVGISTSSANRIYRTADWTLAWQTTGYQGNDCAWNFNRTRLAIVTNSGAPYCRLYDTTSEPGVEIAFPGGGPASVAYACDFHPTRNWLAIAGNQNITGVYSTDTGQFVPFAFAATAQGAKFSPDGTKLAFGHSGAGNKLRVWDLVDIDDPGTWVEVTLNDPITVGNPQAIAWSGDGAYLASAIDDVIPHKMVWDTSIEPWERIANFDNEVNQDNNQDCVFLSAIPLNPERPRTVTGLALTSTVAGSIDASWSVVAAFPPVLGYNINYRAVGDAGWSAIFVGNVLAFTITGLTEGVEYEVRVFAVNDVGSSATATIQTQIVFGVPGQPIVSATPGIEQAQVSWGEPSSNPLPITGYELQVEINDFPGTWYPLVNMPAGTVQDIYSLNSDFAWNFRVRALNSEGAGPWSDPVQAQPIAVSVTLSGLYDDVGVDTNNPVTFNNNQGAVGADWNLDIVGGDGSAITPQIRKGRACWQVSGADAGLIAAASTTIAQPYTVIGTLQNFFVQASPSRIIFRADIADLSASTATHNMWGGVNLLNNIAPNTSVETLFVCEFNGANSTLRVITNDGPTDNTVSGNAGTNPFRMEGLAWSNDLQANRSAQGQFYEFRIYDGLLSTAEKNSVINGLQAKWWNGFPYIDILDPQDP